MAELDGIVLLLSKIKFAGKELGLISEDGVEWGGDAPEYLKVVAAQTRSVVKKVLKKAGSVDLTFKMIELNVANLVDVLGGSADVAIPGKWNAPAVPVTKDGAVEITTVTGQVITIANATLSGNVSGVIGSDKPLAVDITISMINDGVTSPYSINNTAPAQG